MTTSCMHGDIGTELESSGTKDYVFTVKVLNCIFCKIKVGLYECFHATSYGDCIIRLVYVW